MAVDIVMPQMGESIFEGTITKWLKKPGDKVERDEPLFEISTDKVDAEIPSPSAGVLKEIKVGEGKTVPIQTVVGVIDAAGDGAGSAKRAAPAPAPAKAAAPAPAAKPTVAPPPAPPPATAARPTAPAAGGNRCACCSGQRRTAHSQLAAGATHGQGARHRSCGCAGYRLWRTHQQAGHRSGHRGRRERGGNGKGNRTGRGRCVQSAGSPRPLPHRRRARLLRPKRHRQASGGQVHMAFESAVPREKDLFR